MVSNFNQNQARIDAIVAAACAGSTDPDWGRITVGDVEAAAAQAVRMALSGFGSPITTDEIMGLTGQLCEEVRRCTLAGEGPSPLASALRAQLRSVLTSINGQ